MTMMIPFNPAAINPFLPPRSCTTISPQGRLLWSCQSYESCLLYFYSIFLVYFYSASFTRPQIHCLPHCASCHKAELTSSTMPTQYLVCGDTLHLEIWIEQQTLLILNFILPDAPLPILTTAWVENHWCGVRRKLWSMRTGMSEQGWEGEGNLGLELWETCIWHQHLQSKEGGATMIKARVNL